MTSAIKDVGLFAARLREEAGAARGIMVKAGPKLADNVRLDGYVLLTCDEAREVAELIESAFAIVDELGAES